MSQPQYAQRIIPCDCGSLEPYWHGDTLREYCCDGCWEKRQEQTRYKIVRMYQREESRHLRRTIKSGLTLEQAQAHCNDPETSSRTATKAKARRLTEERGPWFDGYEET